jgi:parallel beta-helix repeat protein
MNGTSIQVNNSVVSADYTNSTAGVGVWNVTANVTDGIDIVSNQWNWTIIPQPTYNVSGYVFDNYGSGLGGVLVQNGSNQNTTSASGYYLITGLLSGTYNFSYSEAGFNTGYLEVTISDADHITANKTIYDTTPPAQVTGLINDTPTQTTVNLTWNSIADANYYQVFRNSTSLGYTQNAYWNDTGLTANTLYQYWIRANDSYNNWDQNSTTLNIETASMPDTTPPIIIVASPQNMLYNTASIPLNVSANKVISTWLYSLNGATNVSFTPNTTITASQGANNLIVYASDIAGNWNSTAVAFSVDTIAPSSVTNLMNVSYATYYINWTWTDPADSDFSKVMVYLNGVFRTNVTKGIQYYVASGLTPAITYTISTRTVDLAGNINSTWVNYSSSTALGVYNVNKGTNYSTIQAAINAASLGDTIEVLSGTYYENVYVSNKLILRGVDTGGGKPVVNAGGTGNAIILTGGITLEGFEATNATHAGWPNIGIEVYSDGNIIKNNTASNNGEGINFESGDNNNTLNGNIANSNEYNGIRFNGNNKNNTIIGNNASNNGNNGITFYNTDMSSINNIVTGNIVNNNTLDGIHLEFSINNTIIGNNASNSSDGITFVSSNNNTIIGNNASNNNNGISFTYGNNNTVTSNTANSNKYYGIGLVSSNNTLSSNLANSNGYAGFYINGKNNTIINNTANNNTGSGLISDSSSYNLLLNNTANSNNYDGIYLYYSSNNTITGNFDNLNKYYGIEIYYSSSNTITSNAVNSNTIYGIRLSTSNNNTIYNNRFNNTNNFNFLGTNINIWNTTRTLGSNILGGFNLGGNFWAKPDGTGFSQTCTDANGDGICDSPYALNTNNTDYLPLSLNFTHP